MLTDEHLQSALLLTSHLLQYPDELWLDDALKRYTEWKWKMNEQEIDSVLTQIDQEFVAFIDHLTEVEEITRLSQYVETFDFNKQIQMYVTYNNQEDNRERSLELLKLQQIYADSNFIVDSDELPDYLPLMLEFVAMTARQNRLELLRSYQSIIEQNYEVLMEQNPPYAHLFQIIRLLLSNEFTLVGGE